MFSSFVSKNQPIYTNSSATLFIKREDQLNAFVSGNKYRKLKYNLQEAKAQKKSTLLTFGGAYSNHIAAVAAAGKEHGFKTVGVIRGDELRSKIETNPTLHFAHHNDMEFEFLTRKDYKHKAAWLSTKSNLKNTYIIPEGGTNALAVKGCEEILTPEDSFFDVICCPVGTGGTIAGLANAAYEHQKVLGFLTLNASFLKEDISTFAKKDNWQLIANYHFGGYAKINTKLIAFINVFKTAHHIPLDPVYTGKMLFGITHMINNNYFKNGTKILAIHTGGLQGISGMNTVLERKGLPKLI